MYLKTGRLGFQLIFTLDRWSFPKEYDALSLLCRQRYGDSAPDLVPETRRPETEAETNRGE